MAFLLSKKKEHLIELAEELGLIVEASLTKPKLKDLIVKSSDYIEDDVKREYEEKLRREQREYEEKLRREEREYELEKLRIQAEKNANTMNNPENVQAPKKLRQLFISHRKSNERTWQDFFYEIQTHFDGWISGSNVETFDQLRELIIADQIKKSAPYELREHFLDEWSTINSPAEIAEKFEEYESVRRTLRPKFYNSFAKGRYEASGSSDTYFQRTEYPQGGSNRRERKHFQLNGTSYSGKSKRLTCSYCKGPGHYAVDCTKRPKCSKINNSTDSSIQICSRISRERIKTRKITIGNKIIEALVDSGSSVSLIREDVSKGIIEPSKLSKDISVLIGLGKCEVKTKGSFQRKIELDGEEYSLTWHVVPTPSLEFQVVIGSDILEQASDCFCKESVQFRKHEDKNCFLQMQVYEAEVEDEIVVQHVTNPQIRRELFELISNYEPKKTEMTNVSMRIILKDDIPVYQPARRLSFSENQDVNKQIDEWLEQGIVRPSSSEYASPIVLVKKKDGTTRLCVDYRRLNRKLVKDRFPLPLIEDVLDRLQGAKVYTTLDLKNGFFHVDVNEDCKHLTSFVVPDGQFEFNKVPFCLSTSPSVFQRYVYSIFRELMQKSIVIIYMDDLVIPAKDEKEGLEKLREVLEVASKYGLEMKFKKCQFLRRKVEFLGHVVENGTIRPSIAKTIAVKKFPVPTTVKQVQSFLGLTGYFRKFIPAYSQIAKPLSDLTRKDNPFMFDQPQMEAFEKLKKLLTESPVLSIFQQGRTTELHTDASQQGYCAVLLQEAEDGKLHPVHYMSQKTTPAEEKYSSYELEVLAVVNALKKFRTYLLGNHFKIITDCSAFQKTMDKKDLVTRVARWTLLLEEYDYEIAHRSGQRMQHVDALSRYPVTIITSDTLTARLQRAQQEDENIQNLKIITDRGSPFNSKGFGDYCTEEKIQNLQITTGVPRGNGQVERIHRTLIPILTKLSIDDPTKWYKFVDRLQRILNSTSNRSTKWSPFELLTGVTMRNREDLYLRNLLMEEMVEELQEQRNQLRQDAKRNIQKIQAENKRTYDRKRKKAPRYQKGDLVAIQRTQFGSGLKLRPKFLGPYKVIEVKPRDRYN
ncbi:retrovirus-related Pol polyprotein from transposon 17.6 [Trichonephila clavipes]|nr:retrovirus-related Pol polyprotein from transposon 17.6 [Trichonephila clavipes]